MTDLFFWLFVLSLSLFLLVKSSQYFLKSAENIGLFLGIPPFIIGVTIVAGGTSLPELSAAVLSVLSKQPDIPIGNVVGANISDLFLVLGLAAILGKHIRTEWEILKVDLPLLTSATFLFFFCIMDGVITFFEAIFLIFGYFVYLGYMVSTKAMAPSRDGKIVEMFGIKNEISIKDPIIVILSIFGLYFGAKYAVSSLTEISNLLGFATSVIAASIFSIGTTLPELTVSLVAAIEKKYDIAIANVMGSCIFNIFIVLGVPALLGKLYVGGTVLSFGVPMLIAATLLFFFSTQDKEVSVWEGWIFLSLYFFYIAKLFSII